MYSTHYSTEQDLETEPNNDNYPFDLHRGGEDSSEDEDRWLDEDDGVAEALLDAEEREDEDTTLSASGDETSLACDQTDLSSLGSDDDDGSELTADDASSDSHGWYYQHVVPWTDPEPWVARIYDLSVDPTGSYSQSCQSSR